jgi:cytochrome P450
MMTVAGTGCPFDLDAPEIKDDPYGKYAELRRTCPVGFSETRGGYWYISDYDDVRTVFRSPEVFSNKKFKIPYIDDPVEIPLQLDGEIHARWRDILDPLFTLARVEGYRELARQQCAGLIGDFVAAGGGDFVQAFAIPFPSRIFCILMGLEPGELDQYLMWQRALVRVVNVVNPTTEDRQAVLSSYSDARDAVHKVFARIREERLRDGFRDDVVSALITAEVDGRPVTEDEYHNVCVLLFVAGLETVTATLGNITWWLAEHPAERQRLVGDPSLISKAVEEFLRYESIVAAGRVVAQETELGGQHLVPGDRIMLLTGSAGRDEAVFDQPDEVIFERSPNRHLAFGGGPHRCLGSHLARMELRLAVEEICRSMPDFEITTGAEVVRSMGMIKNFESLPLTVH